jgi:hypothetical protein
LAELGYRDCIGALRRYRVEHPRDVELLSMSSFLIDYPFTERLFPAALVVLKRLSSLGPTVVPSDGDVVFQARKVEHAGLSAAVHGRVLIYIHKEEALDNVKRRSPPEQYVPSGRQVANPGGGQALLGRAGDHRVPAPGHLCSRPESGQRFPAGGRDLEHSRGSIVTRRSCGRRRDSLHVA